MAPDDGPRPTRPHHHGSRFRVPWEPLVDMPSGWDMVRLVWQQVTGRHPPDPSPGDIPREEPRLAPAGRGNDGPSAAGLVPGRPRASVPGAGSADPAPPSEIPSEIRATWIGHATWLIQVGGVNLLTDPHLTRTASPFTRFGPERLVPPALTVDQLPPIHAVVLSHDHYDHLDRPTVDALNARFGDDLAWFSPLGYRTWFAEQGVVRLTEVDWDGTAQLVPGAGSAPSARTRTVAAARPAAVAGPGETAGTELSVTALPAQHWCRRGLRQNTRLWASWLLSFRLPGGTLRTVYFGGDSGYFDGYARRIRPYGPFELSLLPIGAYEPRWFMEYAHMNPEDAVKAYRDLGGDGHVAGMHWGTFRLTFEDPLEPPARMRDAWSRAGLPVERLHLPGIGGTVVLE